MSITDSIYETVGAFTIHVKKTNNVILMRNGKIDSVASIQKIGEMYSENLDCKIMTFTLKKIIKASEGLGVNGLLFFEFLDKHVFIKLRDLKEMNKFNPRFMVSEYELIHKEYVVEIKGGAYESEKELLDSMNIS